MKTISGNSPQPGEIYIKSENTRKNYPKMRGRQLKATTNSPRPRERVGAGQGRAGDKGWLMTMMQWMAKPGRGHWKSKGSLAGQPRVAVDWTHSQMALVQFRPWIMTLADPRGWGLLACHLKTITCSNCTPYHTRTRHGDTFNGHRYVIHNNNLVIARQS